MAPARMKLCGRRAHADGGGGHPLALWNGDGDYASRRCWAAAGLTPMEETAAISSARAARDIPYERLVQRLAVP